MLLPMIMYILGLVFGIVATRIFTIKKPVGYLRIDRSIPEEGPYLFAELKEDIDDISKEKTVTMKVINENYMSRT